MSTEPVLWGHICAGEYTAEVSYRNITSALFFTTAVTWLIAPFAMLAAFPLARKTGMFWAEIPGHVRERLLSPKVWIWESGEEVPRANDLAGSEGWPIRMVLTTPFIALMLLMLGATAVVTLRSAESDAQKLATRLDEEISDNINLRLDMYLASNGAGTDGIRGLLKSLSSAKHGLALIIDRSGTVIASSGETGDPVATLAIAGFRQSTVNPTQLKEGVQYQFDQIIEKPLSRQTWLARATGYEDLAGGNNDWIVLTVIPESYYLAGIHAASSRSAYIFAAALLMSMAMAWFLAALVTSRLRSIALATQALAQGDLVQHVPGSRLTELDALSRSFNDMARRLEGSIDALRNEVETRKQRERALVESERTLQKIFDTAPTALVIARPPTGEIERANAVAFEMFGVDPLGAIGKTVVEQGLVPDLSARQAMYAELQAGRRVEGMEMDILRAGRERRTVSVHADRIELESGDRYIFSMYDLTGLRRAEEELRASAEEMRQLYIRLASVEDDERRALHTRLHGQVGANLTALRLELDIAANLLSRNDLHGAGLQLGGARAVATETIVLARDLMAELRPPALDDYGLVAALRHFAESQSSRLNLPINVVGSDPTPRPSRLVEGALFRIARESVINAARHASASRITIEVVEREGRVVLAIADDGAGFDTDAPHVGPDQWGLKSMHERALAIGGTLEVKSAAGAGTRITANAPMSIATA